MSPARIQNRSSRRKVTPAALQILGADQRLRQHLDMALMHRGQPVAQL